jgi:hypothetical protein
MMNARRQAKIVAIFDQLLALRESVDILQYVENGSVESLRGHQTVDAPESLDLVFQKLHEDIASMEETLATIAEATGDVSKL